MSVDVETKHALALVACARWEEHHIQEWIEYHRSISFDHVYLYSNDDDPSALLNAVRPYVLGPAPFVTFRHWPVPGQRAEIFLHFLRHFKDRTEWFAFLDVDEFLVVKTPGGLPALVSGVEAKADAILFNCFSYGSNGKLRRDDGPVLTSHLRRAAAAETRTKIVCRSAAVDAAAAERGIAEARTPFWLGLDDHGIEGLRRVDVHGAPINGYTADFPAGAEAVLAQAGASDALLATGYVAHYRFKSEADFLRRWRRGGLPDAERWKAMHDSGEHHALLARDNAVYDTYLAAYWHRYTQPALDFAIRVPPESLPAPNVALNKPSWQSSIYEPEGVEPEGSHVSGGGNNGVRTGTYGFHTQLEDSPWWVVDLLGIYGILAVRIFNRVDHPSLAARSAELDILVSMDAAAWTVIYSHADPGYFGGLGGSPLEALTPAAAPARFVAVRLRSRGFLHLDEVEVYGLPL